jgi:predicted deacetylase
MMTPAPADTTASNRRLAIVLHDVAPINLPACERVLGAIRNAALPGPMPPVTLLAVPCYHRSATAWPDDALFDRWLDRAHAQGHELALHGYTHLDDQPLAGWRDRLVRRWYTAAEGEFAALPADEAERRLDVGVAWFRRQGWPLHGFVAPAWLIGAGARAALQRVPFDYTCTLNTLESPPGHLLLHSRSLVYSTRSAWRRVASRWWNGLHAQRQQQAPLLRLELHPQDAEHPAIRRQWSSVLRTALQQRHAVTLHEAVQWAQPG